MSAPSAGAAGKSTGAHGEAHPSGKWGLMLGALGVVYGDIGTSPLYALKECFGPQAHHPLPVTQENVLGVLSLVFWSFVVVVMVKYLGYILRADNNGAGGMMALLALAGRKVPPGKIALVALFGTALLYGEGIITPAISVLSAVEGLALPSEPGAPPTFLSKAVLPITIAILVGLFAIQSRGTGGIGKVFGPVTALWFVTGAALGVPKIIQEPSILWAMDPRNAVTFFAHNGTTGYLLLGSVVLVITGCEALYADMGHFGRGPIRATWMYFVFPALLLNYFGQGVALLHDPSVAANPFYALAPGALRIPVVIIATFATIVASQALISGAFALTQQAVQLGYFPRVAIVHTSKNTEGQIYIPEINAMLFIGCILCVLIFQSSSALAAAYGIAVTGTMTITSIVFYVAATRTWGWPVYKAAPLVGLFLVFDLGFFGANLSKFTSGGWLPVAIGLGAFTVMTTWKRGRDLLAARIREKIVPLRDFLDIVETKSPPRVPGTAVFMASSPDGTPPILRHHFDHNKALHERVLLLSVKSEHVPYLGLEDRVQVEELEHGFWRVTARFGFMQTPNVPAALKLCINEKLPVDLADTSYFLGRETLLSEGRGPMMRWRKTLFSFVSRNARPATMYFGLPTDRVVEMGMQISL
jgi:KUP system potassium uptake protein